MAELAERIWVAEWQSLSKENQALYEPLPFWTPYGFTDVAKIDTGVAYFRLKSLND